mgnify:CR=1 FL=1
MSDPSPNTLTHLDADGHAHMVDVSAKSDTRRVARAALRQPGQGPRPRAGRPLRPRAAQQFDPAGVFNPGRLYGGL